MINLAKHWISMQKENLKDDIESVRVESWTAMSWDLVLVSGVPAELGRGVWDVR